MSSNPNCKLRAKEGYIKSSNVPGTGKKGYIRSIAMTARNIEESKQRSDHRAEQRQQHPGTGGAFDLLKRGYVSGDLRPINNNFCQKFFDVGYR